MSLYADSNYSFNPWMRDLPTEEGIPENLRAEEVIAEIANQVPMPPEATIQPRFGAMNIPMTIEEVLNINQDPLLQEKDTGQPGYGGPALGQW